jgi:eukaryotic-like serine/threonine-protein kinase
MERGEGRPASVSTASPRPGAFTALLRQVAGTTEAERGAAWSEALRPGAVIGRFELVQEIGRGGFGVVWEARDRDLGRRVAFKAVRAGSRAELRQERLLCEAEAAARLSHPNIVTLFDVGRSAVGPYLVMELLTGATLDRRIAAGPLALREALHVGVEVAKGLAHAHARGVAHRDLKPGNIFLCEDGQVKVLDLGLAHAFGHRRVAGGTPAYMAPEQWRGAPEDERTDVFAMGVVLFEMLTGAPPFVGERDASRLGAMGAPELAIPEEPELGELIRRMLAQDPVRRPRDGTELLAALATFASALERAPDAPSGRASPRYDSSESGPTVTALPAPWPVPGPVPSPTPGTPRGVTPASPSGWDPALLGHARERLALYLGPIARVLVARAAGRARSTAELYALLAAQIPSPREREAFLRGSPRGSG